MKRLHITAEEKTAVEVQHQACESRKEGDLRSEGWTVSQMI
jgi:hypothetical protein